MKRRIIYGFILIVFLGGLSLFLYPYISRWNSEKQSKKVISGFKNMIEEEKSKESDKRTDEVKDKESDKKPSDKQSDMETDNDMVNEGQDNQSSIYEDLYQDFKIYNQKIFQEGQKDLKDPFSYETTSFDLRGYGFSGNVIGVLWIPRLNLEFPVYLGADYNHLAKGIGLLGQTSMPTGGENTNMVLAGHRGWHGIPMLRDIQTVQKGDKIQITTPWETLIYRVCEMKVISKDNTDYIYVQRGRDLLTLLTCHPYTQNTMRYVVVAERSMELPLSSENDLEEAKRTKSEEPQEIEVITENGSTTQMISTNTINAVFHEGLGESGTAYSLRQMWLETYVPVIGIGIIVLVAVVLGIFTSRKKK